MSNRKHTDKVDWSKVTHIQPAAEFSRRGDQPVKAAQPLIASGRVDKWLDDLRGILVDRSEFKLADHVVSARVVIKMLENERAKQAAELERVKALVREMLTYLVPLRVSGVNQAKLEQLIVKAVAIVKASQ